MDSRSIREQLAFAEEVVSRADEHVWKQRTLVVQLERRGHNAALARRLLTLFEEGYALHVMRYERLKAALAALGEVV